MRVENVMTRRVIVTGPDTSLKNVARILLEHGVSGLPVVDAEGHVLGVVSETDILVKESATNAPHLGLVGWPLEEARDLERKLTAHTAGEAMSSPPIVVDLGFSVVEAAARMLDTGVNRLPVVDGDKLVGIVTRADLVRAFVRPDEQIAREIREDVVRRMLPSSRDGVKVRVEQGEVTLQGRVESKTEAELVEASVARVPGVVAVRSSMTWRTDERAARAVGDRGND